MSIEDSIENILKRMFAKYIVLEMKPSGIIFRRYFWSYDEMEDCLIYCQFTPNIKYAKGYMIKNRHLVRMFSLEDAKKK